MLGKYTTSRTKILIVCASTHEFELLPDKIRGEHWCNKCLDTARLEFEQIVKQKMETFLDYIKVQIF